MQDDRFVSAEDPLAIMVTEAQTGWRKGDLEPSTITKIRSLKQEEFKKKFGITKRQVSLAESSRSC